MISSRTVLSLALLGSLTFVVGCANIWHELKPHRMQRLNRYQPPALDPEFTQWQRPNPNKLAKQETPAEAAKMSVNHTEDVAVRAQSPSED